jgi:hypothetical protein
MAIRLVAVAALALLLWCVLWAAGFLGSGLPKRDWKRRPLKLLFPAAMGAIIIAQFSVLTTLVSDKIAHSSALYILGFDCPIGIVLLFWARNREERAKKRSAMRQPVEHNSAQTPTHD